MDDAFQARVRAAAIAAWWTLVVAAAFVTFQWLVYVATVSVKPAFVLSLWGPGATWGAVRTLWFQALALLKLSLWPLALVAVWLTLWARQLRRNARIS